MCFEGMEESGSEGLDELISEEKDKFFKGVDCVCISGKRCEAWVLNKETHHFSAGNDRQLLYVDDDPLEYLRV